MKAALILVCVALILLCLAVTGLALVVRRLVKVVHDLHRAQRPTVMLSPVATGSALADALDAYRRAGGRVGP